MNHETWRRSTLVCLSSVALIAAACGDDSATGGTGATGSGGETSTTSSAGGQATTSTGGAGGASTTSTGGSGGATAIAAEIDGYRIELPCENPDATSYNEGDNCNWNPALADQTGDPNWELKSETLKTIGGDAGTVYDVEIRFRGISEPKNYQGGTLVGEHFYIGGTEVVDNYNVYSIKVNDPPETYHLTRTETPTGHYIVSLDYTATIPMRGGTTVTIGMYDHNTAAISNGGGVVVDGVAPAPAPYSGHFIQMDVISVTPRQ